MASVQFIGKSEVLDAFENRGIEVWGLFEKKTFICGGSSVDELREFLTRLEKSNTTAIYTLKVYRDAQDADALTDKMECNGSFNFKLNSEARAVGADGSFSAIMARMDRIEQKLSGADEDEDDEPDTLESRLIGLLDEPEKLIGIIGAVKALFGGGVAGAAMAAPVPAAVGAFNDRQGEQENERLFKAIEVLKKTDPLIVDHLGKLADLSINNPALFKMLIQQLDAL